jgi:hypothetical protein
VGDTYSVGSVQRFGLALSNGEGVPCFAGFVTFLSLYIVQMQFYFYCFSAEHGILATVFKALQHTYYENPENTLRRECKKENKIT